jgi:hypothetical protein
MKTLRTAAGLAAAVLLVGACGGSRPGPVPPPAAGPGPLPAGPENGLCGEPTPGTVTTQAFYIAKNATSSPLRITGASLTGTRAITVDGAWADFLPPGAGAIGDLNGYPPPGWRHPLALTVPAGAAFEVMFTLTTGRSSLVTGERISYTWRGRSYMATGKWFLGVPPGMHCWKPT